MNSNNFKMDNVNALKVIDESKVKQPKLAKHLMEVISNKKLSHAYLFSGTNGSGKLAVATLIAMRLFCRDVQPDGFPCGKCDECVRIADNEHPDVLVVEPDGRSVKIDQVRQLKREFTKSGVEGNQKVFIVDGADTMTDSAANGLLKFIEEPNDNVNSFLLTDDFRQILPTIISRTQLVEFPLINEDDLKAYSERKGLSKTSVQLIINITNDINYIDKMCEEDWFNKTKVQIESWFNLLENDNYKAFTAVQTNLVGLAPDRYSQKIILAMMYQIFRDVFDIKFKDAKADQLGFGDIYGQLKEMADFLTAEQLIKIINLILSNTKTAEINVAFQSILEVITLRSLIIIEE